MPSETTVIIPHWNRAALLDRLLTTIGQQSVKPARVLVVDNGSTDRSADVAAQHGAGFMALNENRGFAHAVNRGVAASSTKWVAVVNNDVELHPLWLQTLLDEAERSQAWFAAPRLVQLKVPGQLDGCFDLLARSACAWRAGHGASDEGPYAEPRTIAFAPLTATLLRRELFERAGLLDERFESYLEDVEFGLRCALQSLGGVYVPQAEAYHAGSSTLGPWSPRMVQLLSRNQLLLAAKHFPTSYMWNVLVGQSLWGALALRHKAGAAWLRGKVAGLRLFSGVRATASPAARTALDPILRACEREIRQLQPASRRETYWRAYFTLAP